VNNSPVRRYLYWVDRGGGAHSYGFMESYSRRLTNDYVGRFWMIVDPRTKAQELYEVKDEESEIVVE